MKAKSILFAFVSFVFLFTACSKDSDTESTGNESTGKVTGKVTTKNGSKPIGGALVFVTNDQNKLYYTRTDATGNFSLDAPVGSRNLNIQTGNGVNFRTVLHLDIVKGQTQAINPTQTRLDQVARMAYVTGNYDSIQTIITSMGYTIDMITNDNLLDYNVVSQYDIIYLNCGAKVVMTAPNQQIMDINLANFVTNGGSLYVSDWAMAYLIGGERHTDQCGDPHGFIPDDKICAMITGQSMTIQGAQVTDTALAASVGFSTLDIAYDLNLWEEISTFDETFWDVLVHDPTSNKPLMIKTNHFSGGTVSQVVGRNAADEGWVAICHHETAGDDPITITIPESEWAAHEAHGDSMGSCTTSTNSGTIYYTTFHNEVGANIANTEPILQYVILNL